MYNVVISHLCTVQSDYHDKPSTRMTPFTVITIKLTIGSAFFMMMKMMLAAPGDGGGGGGIVMMMLVVAMAAEWLVHLTSSW